MGPVLIAGGAGYIGSCCARLLARRGMDVAVLDNLSAGHAASVPGLPLFEGDLSDSEAVGKALAYGGGVEAVILFASFTSVPESLRRPDQYYSNNLSGAIRLLEAMVESGARKIVFSSSAAVYGTPEVSPIPESAPKAPISPYGRIKLMIEETLEDFRAAGMLEYAALRYFNAAGAEPGGDHGEDHSPETHLVPLAVKAGLGTGPALKVFGTDYPTPDGSCLRDYVHVSDLARAHVAVLDRLGPEKGLVFNVGTGRGSSVLEVLSEVSGALGQEVPYETAGRRPGDPPALVADPALIGRDLGFTPEFGLREIVRSAVAWHRARPRGYGDR